MAFIILKLKENVEEPYAIYNLEKFGLGPFKKKLLTVGSVFSDDKDITLIRTKTKRKSFGEIVKTKDGWCYKFINKKKEMLKGVFKDGLRIPIFDNIIEFKEEL